MNRFLLLLAALIFFTSPTSSPAVTAKIRKVLPHYLDQEGRHSLSPSLYERDAYQALLRTHPELRSGLRFNIHWKPAAVRPTLMKVQLRGTSGEQPTQSTLSQIITPHSGWSLWSSISLAGQPYQEFGQLISWRVTIWDGDTLLAEQKSFLW